MQINQIRDILDKINNISIAVYGDFCLDAYWLMDPDGSEVSVETGLHAEAVARHVYSPGGAGNIVANLAALKPSAIKVIGVIDAGAKAAVEILKDGQPATIGVIPTKGTVLSGAYPCT